MKDPDKTQLTVADGRKIGGKIYTLRSVTIAGRLSTMSPASSLIATRMACRYSARPFSVGSIAGPSTTSTTH